MIRMACAAFRAEVARLYGCDRARVIRLIRNGTLRATRAPSTRIGWRIDPFDAERCAAELSAPKRTWRQTEPDQGDLYQRRLRAARRGQSLRSRR